MRDSPRKTLFPLLNLGCADQQVSRTIPVTQNRVERALPPGVFESCCSDVVVFSNHRSLSDRNAGAPGVVDRGLLLFEPTIRADTDFAEKPCGSTRPSGEAVSLLCRPFGAAAGSAGIGDQAGLRSDRSRNLASLQLPSRNPFCHRPRCFVVAQIESLVSRLGCSSDAPAVCDGSRHPV